MLSETRTVRSFADIAVNPATSGDDLHALRSTLVHSVGGMVVLLMIQTLNVYKPRGLTPYGWREQQEQRAASPTTKVAT